MEENGRINRYIMECKCVRFVGSGNRAFELIDTLWNVNLLPPRDLGSNIGINRYIMECK